MHLSLVEAWVVILIFSIKKHYVAIFHQFCAEKVVLQHVALHLVIVTTFITPCMDVKLRIVAVMTCSSCELKQVTEGYIRSNRKV